MNFSDFCKKIKPHTSIETNGLFVYTLFTAGGSMKFLKKRQYTADSYEIKLYNGSKPLTKPIKNSFQQNIDKEKFISTFEPLIGESSLRTIMDNFAISSDSVAIKDLFLCALCLQLQIFMNDAENDIEDIVAVEYNRLLADKDLPFDNSKPLYTNDNFLILSDKEYNVTVYQEIEHNWSLYNNGQVEWKDRYLECITKTRATDGNAKIVPIPTTAPNGRAQVQMKLNARNEAKLLTLQYVMKDKDGRNCFPNKLENLKITLNIKLKAEG